MGTKGGIAEALATSCELKKSVCSKLVDTLAEVAQTEVSKTGLFSVPGLCRLKLRTKPATKGGFPSGSPEEEHLSREPVVLACSIFQSSCHSGPDCAASRGHSAEVASSARRYMRARPLWMASLAEA